MSAPGDTSTPEKNTPETKTPEKKTPEKKTPEKKTPEKKTPEKKTPEKKTPEKKTPGKKTPENSPGKKTPEKSPGKKTPEKSPGKESPEKFPEYQTADINNMNRNMNYKFQVACRFIQAHIGLGKERTVYLDALCKAMDKMEYVYDRNKEWRLFSTRGISDIFVKRPYQAVVMVMAKDAIDEEDEARYRQWKLDINSPVFLINFGQEGGPELKAYI